MNYKIVVEALFPFMDYDDYKVYISLYCTEPRFLFVGWFLTDILLLNQLSWFKLKNMIIWNNTNQTDIWNSTWGWTEENDRVKKSRKIKLL